MLAATAPISEQPSRMGLALLGAVALASLNTKIAGVAWLLLLVWAATVWRQRNRSPDVYRPDALLGASRLWLLGLLIYAGTELAMTWGWHGACCSYTSEVNSFLRLVTAAVATLVLVRHLRPWPGMRHHINLAVVTALTSGAVLAAIVGRDLPAHPIPWAAGMVFLVCVLMPHAWDLHNSPGRRCVYGLGSAMGVAGVLLSQSRGSFVVLAFPVILLVLHASRGHRRALVLTGATGLLTFALLGGLAVAPSDPLRLRLAAVETQQALQTKDFNSSLGARVYLTQLSWHHFTEAPWAGVGASERLNLLKNAGLDLSPTESEGLSHVRTLGHVHNQYLHHALDNGVFGLAGFLALLACMMWISLRLRTVSSLASLQLSLITLSHGFVSLSNVNMAHNFYALTWGLSVALVFLQTLVCDETDRARVLPTTRGIQAAL